jgi:hypothetical protein
MSSGGIDLTSARHRLPILADSPGSRGLLNRAIAISYTLPQKNTPPFSP